MNRKIYLCGGVSPSNTIFVASCEAFDVDAMRWDSIASLPSALHHCAAVGLDEFIYLSGGQLQHPERTTTNQLLRLKSSESGN